jgi:hypothetical protein
LSVQGRSAHTPPSSAISLASLGGLTQNKIFFSISTPPFAFAPCPCLAGPSQPPPLRALKPLPERLSQNKHIYSCVSRSSASRRAYACQSGIGILATQADSDPGSSANASRPLLVAPGRRPRSRGGLVLMLR